MSVELSEEEYPHFALRSLALLEAIHAEDRDDGVEAMKALWPLDMLDASRVLMSTLSLLSSVYQRLAEETGDCPHCLVGDLRESIVAEIAEGQS